MSTHRSRWAAVYILAALCVAALLAQFISSLYEFTQTQHTHGEPFAWQQFAAQFIARTMENWQSEFLQLVVQALLLESWLSLRLFRANVTTDEEQHSELMRTLHDIRERLS